MKACSQSSLHIAYCQAYKLSLTNHQFTGKFSNRNFWVEQEEVQRRRKYASSDLALETYFQDF